MPVAGCLSEVVKLLFKTHGFGVLQSASVLIGLLPFEAPPAMCS